MKQSESFAIITVSRQGVQKAMEVKKRIEEKNPDIYTMEKYATKETRLIRGKIVDFFGELMAEYDTILCIMATGIVVRSIAPHLGHKSEDPGILVMDQEGNFVISLLSGHLGHANKNAIDIAKKMEAQPVITTGTDVMGTMAVDTLSETLGCSIANFTAAKEVTALILDGAPVAVIDDESLDTSALVLPKNITLTSKEKALSGEYSGLILSSTKGIIDFDLQKSVAQIVPRKITIGVGCRKDTPGNRILEALQGVLKELNLHPLSVKTLATIGLKEKEQGIHEVCQNLGAELKVIPDDFVKMVQSHFEGSEFVYQTTGLYAVSEPCGYVASGFGDCLLKKRKCEGITLSVWKNKE